MKVNMPVTNKELDYPTGAILLSKTDPKGIITEVNDAFVEVSGFSREELIGKSHNIVRHPDMPPAAFEDLWKTIKKGKLWHGYVKNRCKNGDHYWVEANVTPIMQGREITGYVSVRTKPDAARVAAAEKLYRTLKKGSGGKFMMHLRGIADFNVQAKLILAILTLFGISGVTVLAGFSPWVAGGINLVLTMVFGPLILRSITRPLQELAQAMMATQADGNLKRRVTAYHNDEIGQAAKAYNALLATISSLTKEVTDSAEKLVSHSQSLSEITEAVQENSNQQNDAASATASAVEEMTVSISSVAESVDNVRNTAHTSVERTHAGNEGVSQMVGEITGVEQSVHSISESVAKFIESTKQINNMTQEVREIADQTNLLALNAAIEAARAGEQGRGFAVVADEVRKLAEKSSASARAIDEITRSISEQSTEVESSITSGLEHLSSTQDLLENIAIILGESSHSVQNVTNGMDSITGATQEQAMASTQIAQNVEKIAQMTENNAQAIRQTAEAAHQLNALARNLKSAIMRFQQ